MPTVGHWSDEEDGGDSRSASRNVSPEAFMEELCAPAGGYGKFFWTLIWHYVGWWAAVGIVPTVFLDHHKCEAQLSFLAWTLYGGTVFAMVAMAVLMELSMVQRLGLLNPGELSNMLSQPRWQTPLVSTVLWKISTYMNVAFIFIARDCGSSLWQASLATFVFMVFFGQLVFNTCFACTDCEHELPKSFGFVLLDFKLVNTAIRDCLPFDPDANDLPVAKPVTLRTSGHLIGMEKVVGDIAQVCIQIAFLHNQKAPQTFVMFSILIGMVHGTLALITVIRECVQDEWDLHSRMPGALMPTSDLPQTELSPAPKLSPAPMKTMSSLGEQGRTVSDQPTRKNSGTRAQQIGKSIEAPPASSGADKMRQKMEERKAMVQIEIPDLL